MLGGVIPARGGLDRDTVLFEAGRRGGRTTMRRRERAWQGLCAAMVVACVGMAVGYRGRAVGDGGERGAGIVRELIEVRRCAVG